MLAHLSIILSNFSALRTVFFCVYYRHFAYVLRESCINMKRKISTKWKNCILLCKWNVSEALGDLLAFISGMPFEAFFSHICLLYHLKNEQHLPLWNMTCPAERTLFAYAFDWTKEEQFLTCCSYWGGAHFRQEQITEFFFTLKQFFSLVFLCCCCVQTALKQL